MARSTKYPNVYIDTSAYKSRRYPREFVEYLRGHGRHKVLFGSNYPMLTPRECLQDLALLALDEERHACFWLRMPRGCSHCGKDDVLDSLVAHTTALGASEGDGGGRTVTQYLGLDWLAMCLTFTAIYLLGNKSSKGFVIMMAGNLCWSAIGLWAHSYAMVLANLGFFSMNVRGFLKWARTSEHS